jgi:hypothetical protein
MRRVLVLVIAATAGALSAGCTTPSRQAGHYDAQPPAGSSVITRQATPAPAAEPGHLVRLSHFDRADCKL